ncbi:MAG: hypothetical protein ABI175_23655, partial [Polyangiales bacterium]
MGKLAEKRRYLPWAQRSDAARALACGTGARFREPLLLTEVEPSVVSNSALMERHDDLAKARESVAPAHPDAPGVPFPPVAED